MTYSDDRELSHEEILLAEESAPSAIAELIRSRDDAIAIYRVVRGDIVIHELDTAECDEISTCLQHWGTTDFPTLYAPRILAACSALDDLTTEHYDLEALLVVRVPLYALDNAVSRYLAESDVDEFPSERTG